MSNQVYLTEEEYLEELKLGQQALVEELHELAPFQELILKDSKDFTRKDVVQAFQQAFELIGGPIGLAAWASQNRSQFYKLYAKLLPSQASSALGETTEVVVKHVLPRTELDE